MSKSGLNIDLKLTLITLLTAAPLAGLPVYGRGIQGKVNLDSTWVHTAYLSHIGHFTDMYAINYEIILGEAPVDNSGLFHFDKDMLYPGDHLYRLHFVRNGSPPATLIIGGNDENHIFFIANPSENVFITASGEKNPWNETEFSGYSANDVVLQAEQLISLADTIDYQGISNTFVQSVLFEKLRYIADTTPNQVASHYVLYKTNVEEDVVHNETYYRNYFDKWEDKDSPFYKELEKKAALPPSNPYGNYIIPVLIAFVTGMGTYHLLIKYSKKRQRNLIKNLSRQEVRIFELLKEGKSNKEIAEASNIEVSTVKSHVNSIYSKLNINSRRDIQK
jgi:DNA-binding CsgD family transcriptional regulator